MSLNEICRKSTSYCLALLQSAPNPALTCKQANSDHYSLYLKWITHIKKPALRAVSAVPQTERTVDPWISLSTEIGYCDMFVVVHIVRTLLIRKVYIFILFTTLRILTFDTEILKKHSSRFLASANYIGIWTSMHEVEDGIKIPAIKI